MWLTFDVANVTQSPGRDHTFGASSLVSFSSNPEFPGTTGPAKPVQHHSALRNTQAQASWQQKLSMVGSKVAVFGVQCGVQ